MLVYTESREWLFCKEQFEVQKLVCYKILIVIIQNSTQNTSLLLSVTNYT
jgi:hypothetical protein